MRPHRAPVRRPCIVPLALLSIVLTAPLASGQALARALQDDRERAIKKEIEQNFDRVRSVAEDLGFRVERTAQFDLVMGAQSRAEDALIDNRARAAALLVAPPMAMNPEAIADEAFEVAVKIVANTHLPRNFVEIAGGDRNSAPLAPAPDVIPAGSAASAARFDARDLQKGRGPKNVARVVTPVRTYLKDTGQGTVCGCCWCFAAVAAFEAGLVDNGADPKTLDVSEQQVLNCSGSPQGNNGGCGGEWYWVAFQHLVEKGAVDESTLNYTGFKTGCVAAPGKYFAATYGLVGDKKTVPGVAALKQALVDHGPLAVCVMADRPFLAYRGGVFKATKPYPWINHAVLLIGWDEDK